jgi:hypothetical protein
VIETARTEGGIRGRIPNSKEGVNIMKSIACISVAMLFSSAALSQNEQAQSATGVANLAVPVAGKADPQDKMVCRTEETIGSRLGGHRECHTRRDWDRMAQDSRNVLDRNTRQLGRHD